MRTRRTISATFAALAIALAAAGCNSTTQPTSSPVQTASITFHTGGKVNVYDCWELWVDTDNNGVPDQDTFQLSCIQQMNGTDPVQAAVENLPWRYSLAITVIRAGQTQEQIIAASIIPGDNIDDFVSMTPYDTGSDTGGTHAFDGTYYYVTPGGVPPNGSSKKVTNASRLWLEGNGFFLGEPNVLEQIPPTFNVDLNLGDTLIVRARKQKRSDAPPFLSSDTDPELALTGTVSLGGVQVPLQGTSATSFDDMAGMTFSYTRR